MREEQTGDKSLDMINGVSSPFGKTKTHLGLSSGSFALRFLSNNLKILGAMILFSLLCAVSICPDVGGWDECVTEVGCMEHAPKQKQIQTNSFIFHFGEHPYYVL